jgi:phosphatidylglycerophosphate synthase
MPNRIARHGAADVALTAAVYLATACWLVSMAAPDAWTGLLAVGAGSAVLGLAAGSILRREPPLCTPADRVTLLRALLVACCGVLAVTDVLGGHDPGPVLISLAAAAFALDAVDGQVARRTGSASAAGARLDTETDAALTLVLSGAAAPAVGPWTLLIGLLYYVFAVLGRCRPALRRSLPPSPVRKAIGACQPAGLLLALLPGTPAAAATAVLLTALALLLFSFGRDAAALERMHRSELRRPELVR